MCGIWALFGHEAGNISEQCMYASRISHRGPDGFRIESIGNFSNCCAANYRLSTLNLNMKGIQPMRIDSCPDVLLLCDAEIYNYQQIKTDFGLEFSTGSDEESIIHLYTRKGIKATASMLDGDFAFCLVDLPTRKVFVARDVFGVKPLYRLKGKDGLMALSSEAKGLIGLQKQKEANIEEFPPGTVETYKLSEDGKITLLKSEAFLSVETYSPNPHSLSVEATCSKVHDLFSEAVRKRLISDKRIGCFLSGGIDSSLVAALTCRFQRQLGIKLPVQTFTVVMAGSTDASAARKVAGFIGSEHHEFLFTPEEGIAAIDKVIYHTESYDVITLRPAIAMYLLSRYIKAQTDSVVLLSGEAGDEVTHGYAYFHRTPSKEASQEESTRLLKDIHLYDVLRAERTTAAYGLEIRIPFLDKQFVSYYTSLDPSLKMPGNQQEKYLLRYAFSKTDLLPDEILWRPKEGFCDALTSPEKYWYQYLREYIEGKVTDEQLKSASTRFPFNTPKNKEEYYYRQVFEKHFEGNSHWVPYQWAPKWLGTCDDPSIPYMELSPGLKSS